MEVKFIQNTLQCLQPVLSQVHTAEQTQEIRLPDAYPDMGKILGCWGQVMIRGKEWRSGNIGTNGGVMAFVLYAPEDGTQPRVVEAWIPIQSRWDVPGNEEDGVMHVCAKLSNLDARGISARKMMVRATVDTFVQAMARQMIPVHGAPDLPEDVQLLKKSYPVQVPKEAGEKQVQIDERFAIAGNQIPVHKIVRYTGAPVITEQKILGNRLVFRGQVDVDIMYMSEDGQLQQWKTEFPFSQYTELDRDYSPQTTGWVLPVLTALEAEVIDGEIQLRGGMAAQYTIFDEEVLEIVADAFSSNRSISLTKQDLKLPILLDKAVVDIQMEGAMNTEASGALSVSVNVDYPVFRMGDNGTEIGVNGYFQAIMQDVVGQLSAGNARTEAAEAFPTSPENTHILWPGYVSNPTVMTTGNGFSIKTNYPVEVLVYSGEALPMVTELEMGELREPNPDRASIVLCRAGEGGLWELAKKCGSSVSAIQKANQLSGEPDVGQMLLIPVQ